MNPHSPSPASERELLLSRIIDAPRERVFAAWTRHLPEWWGPHGMTTPVCEMDRDAPEVPFPEPDDFPYRNGMPRNCRAHVDVSDRRDIDRPAPAKNARAPLNPDPIRIDSKTNAIELEVDAKELERRRKRWRPPPLAARRGTLAKYIRSVRPASEGCVTDE